MSVINTNFIKEVNSLSDGVDKMDLNAEFIREYFLFVNNILDSFNDNNQVFLLENLIKLNELNEDILSNHFKYSSFVENIFSTKIIDLLRDIIVEDLDPNDENFELNKQVFINIIKYFITLTYFSDDISKYIGKTKLVQNLIILRCDINEEDLLFMLDLFQNLLNNMDDDEYELMMNSYCKFLIRHCSCESTNIKYKVMYHFYIMIEKSRRLSSFDLQLMLKTLTDKIYTFDRTLVSLYLKILYVLLRKDARIEYLFFERDNLLLKTIENIIDSDHYNKFMIEESLKILHLLLKSSYISKAFKDMLIRNMDLQKLYRLDENHFVMIIELIKDIYECKIFDPDEFCKYGLAKFILDNYERIPKSLKLSTSNIHIYQIITALIHNINKEYLSNFLEKVVFALGSMIESGIDSLSHDSILQLLFLYQQFQSSEIFRFKKILADTGVIKMIEDYVNIVPEAEHVLSIFSENNI